MKYELYVYTHDNVLVTSFCGTCNQDCEALAADKGFDAADLYYWTYTKQ